MPATIIAILNEKGGVGKTTSSVCIAQELAARSYKVLLVDLDRQHNASDEFSAAIEGEATAYDLFSNRSIDIHEVIQSTRHGDIIAGDNLLVTLDIELSKCDSREYILADALVKVVENYDFIIMDCPPDLDLIVKNALVAATHVIIPVLSDRYALQGFDTTLHFINEVKSNARLNPGLEVMGVVVCQYDMRNRLDKSYAGQLPAFASEYGVKSFSTPIRKCVKAGEARELGVSLYEHAPDCTTASDYRSLVNEIIERS